MRRPDLVADCASCAAVCCVATSFEASSDFAYDKPAGVGCRYLDRDRCAIHDELIARGFSGCAVYDCHGAGPRVTRAFAAIPDAEARRNEAFLVLRVVHELLWLLTEAARICPPTHDELDAQLARQIAALDAIACDPTTIAVAAVDLRPHHEASRALLRRVGAALGGRRHAARRLSVVG